MGWAKSMPFASINPTNPRTNPWNFHEKILRIGGAGKWGFFEAAILNFLSRPFWIFFCFISVKNPALLYEVSFFSALWMVFPESWKRRVADFYAHHCKNVELRAKNKVLKYLSRTCAVTNNPNRKFNTLVHRLKSPKLVWHEFTTVASSYL